jgi:hypothetical protein
MEILSSLVIRGSAYRCLQFEENVQEGEELDWQKSLLATICIAFPPQRWG